MNKNISIISINSKSMLWCCTVNGNCGRVDFNFQYKKKACWLSEIEFHFQLIQNMKIFKILYIFYIFGRAILNKHKQLKSVIRLIYRV